MKTFLDTGALIVAHRGEPHIRKQALDIIEDVSREFVISDFLRLELLPKAIYHRQTGEVAFYELYFSNAKEHVSTSKKLFKLAFDEAKTFGLNAADALHIAAAKAKGCEEFYTTEDKKKPLFRVKGIKVISLLSSIRPS